VDSVHGDLSQPGTKRSLPLPLEPGDFSNQDDEDLLRQVLGLIAETGDTAEPPLNQGQVDSLEALPVGGIRSRLPEPIEQTDGCPVHGRSPSPGPNWTVRKRGPGVKHPVAYGHRR